MMNKSNPVERRRFSRIPFEAAVSITGPKGKWTGKLIDISLNGVLISRPQNWLEEQEETLMAEIHPPGDAFTIRMEVKPAHAEENHVGFRCEHIDLDSVSHLRRLVELNLGNEEILTRELAEMIHREA